MFWTLLLSHYLCKYENKQYKAKKLLETYITISNFISVRRFVFTLALVILYHVLMLIAPEATPPSYS